MSTLVPPSDTGAEERLVACCMIDPGTVSRAIELGVSPASFSSPVAGLIFDLVVKMLGAGSEINEVTVYQEIIRQKLPVELQAFARITARCATSVGAEQAIEIVSELATARRAMFIGMEVTRACADFKGGNIIDRLAEPIQQLLSLASSGGTPEPSWDQVIDDADRLTTELVSGLGRASSTIDFPWAQMNSLFGPMERGQLVVLAARTSIGKSSLVRPIAAHAAGMGKRVYFDTLEVAPVKIAMQLAASLSRVGVRKLSTAHPKDQQDFRWALVSLRNAGITMSRKDRTLAQVVARSKALHSQGKVDLIVIDHGGQLRDVFESKDKVSAIGRVTKTLKELAVELECVVILLWQLNRGSEKENNREPVLSDLKDSGSLEEDADKVIFIHRPSEDPITGLPQNTASSAEEQPRFFQNVIQAKGRDEGTSLMSFYFERQIATFYPAKKV